MSISSTMNKENVCVCVCVCVCVYPGFPGSSTGKVKNLLAMRETAVRFLVWKDSLEKG